MNRREFLQCAAILVGSAGVSGHALALSQPQLTYLDSRKISVRDLVSKYGLSEPHIYRVIKSQQKIQCSRKI